MVPELLARMHVGDVHFHQRRGPGRARVAQGYRGVGERARVEHHRHPVSAASCSQREQLGFAVGLAHLHGEPQLSPAANA